MIGHCFPHQSEKGSFKSPLWGGLGIFLLGTLIFSLAYSQAPLFTSNQNQYFLHGLARAGYGYLSDDWSAQTKEPTPLFSVFVEWTYRLLDSVEIFYVYYALLMGVYFFSLMGIAAKILQPGNSRLKKLILVTLVICIHSAGWRFVLAGGVGDQWAYLIEDGFADQRLLGPVLQPSTFGVFLLASIALYLLGKPYLAVLAAVFAASVHPTYLLSAACLTLAYMLDDFLRNRRFRRPLSLGGVALLSVLPILVYVWGNFSGIPAETTERARQILVYFRVPHHALVSEWFDATAIVKLVIIALGVFLARKSRLFWVIFIPSLVGLSLSLLQIATGDEMLALIFPWRVSTWLIPLSMILILVNLIELLYQRFQLHFERYLLAVQIACLVLVALAVLSGSLRMWLDFQERDNLPENQVLDFVRSSIESGQTYLIPIKMLNFRLETGAPAYVDFKTPPYADEEVIEWRRRIVRTQRFYQRGECDLLGEFANHGGVTHVVMPGDANFSCPSLTEIYQDEAYRVYELVNSSSIFAGGTPSGGE